VKKQQTIEEILLKPGHQILKLLLKREGKQQKYLNLILYSGEDKPIRLVKDLTLTFSASNTIFL